MSNATRSTFAARAETFSHICTPIAICLAMFQFGCDARKEAEQRRFEIYNQINDQYVQFLETCVQHPWVDCFDSSAAELVKEKLANAKRDSDDIDPRPKSAKEQKIEAAAFASLLSLLERAYVFYKKTLPEGDPMVMNQWDGWRLYAESFAKRDRFREQWSRLGTEFDISFQAWINGLIATAGK